MKLKFCGSYCIRNASRRRLYCLSILGECISVQYCVGVNCKVRGFFLSSLNLCNFVQFTPIPLRKSCKPLGKALKWKLQNSDPPKSRRVFFFPDETHFSILRQQENQIEVDYVRKLSKRMVSANQSRRLLGCIFRSKRRNGTILNSPPFWHACFHVCPVKDGA